MSSYTKGEWKVNPTDDINDFHIGCVCKFQTLGIADVETDYTGEEEALANARLIAAAPALLEACKEAKELLTDMPDCGGTWQNLDAAIAKAKP